MTFRRRLLLSQLPLTAALLLVGGAAVRTVSRLGVSAERILQENYRSALAAQRMREALDLLDRDALLRALGRTPTQPDAVLRDDFESELRLQVANITEVGEENATLRLRSAWEDYQRARALAASAADPAGAYAGRVQDRSNGVRVAAQEILALNQAAMVRKSGLARSTARRLLLFMAGTTLVALALGFVASTALIAKTVRPLTTLTRTVRRFGEGHLAARARPTGAGEIAALGHEFNTMAERLERYQKSTLGELLQAQRATQAAIDSLPDPVVVLDRDGAVLNLNRAAEAVFLLDAGQGVDAPLPRLPGLPGERLEAVRTHVLAGRGPYVPRGFDEAMTVEGVGGPRRLLPRATALRSAEGEISGVAMVLQDVTRLVRIDELRNDVVSTVAHEFRTPLTSLQMAVHLCGDRAAGPLTEEQAELMAGARQDCDRLLTLVDDILDLSRIQAGKIEIEARPADAGALLARASAAAEPSALAKEIALEVVPVQGELTVLADAERVDVVLANLIGNAVRHTPVRGRIALRAARAGAAARFEVQDTGPGIAPAHREQIFERFFQVPGSTRGGLGLGLYISREIVQAHGGTMGVESEEGGGSTLWFTLPLV